MKVNCRYKINWELGALIKHNLSDFHAEECGDGTDILCSFCSVPDRKWWDGLYVDIRAFRISGDGN